jgi:thioredoxin reductase (NADPH)
LFVREFVVYSRRGCHLCDELLEQLEPLCRGKARVTVRDVDTKAEWASAYGDLVPVLCLDDQELCRYTLDHRRVKSVLATMDS